MFRIYIWACVPRCARAGDYLFVRGAAHFCTPELIRLFMREAEEVK